MRTQPAELWVVMPVCNEEACIERVVAAWLPVLRDVAGDFVLCALDDGSTDATRARLEDLARRNPELKVVAKPNSGHGQTCLAGYRLALEAEARWVLQIDSDGQCDPQYFRRFWELRDHDLVYGYRARREDGLTRFAISRLVSLVAFAATGVYVRDANVPYRLMASHVLQVAFDITPDVHLANVMLAVVHQREHRITWVDIEFRERMAGTASVRTRAFAGRGLEMYRQLRTATPRSPRSPGVGTMRGVTG